MAKETIHSERPAQNTATDASINTFYADNSLVTVRPSDVRMYFGMQPPTDGEDVPFESCVILSHSSFMRMMEYWVPRYELLAKIYAGHPMSLNDFNQNTVEQAFHEMLYPAQEAEQPEDKEG